MSLYMGTEHIFLIYKLAYIFVFRVKSSTVLAKM